MNKKLLLSMKSWLVSRDPKIIVSYNPNKTG